MRKRIDFSVVIISAAAAAVAVGSALTWVDARGVRGAIHVRGLTGDGKVTVLCAAAATVAASASSLRRSTSPALPSMAVLASAMMSATAWYDTFHLRNAVAASGRLSDGILATYLGTGLWVVDIASIAVLAGSVLAMHNSRVRRTDVGLAVPLPRLADDLVVSRTVVVTLPRQRAETETAEAES
jgi:hypothetical protein